MKKYILSTLVIVSFISYYLYQQTNLGADTVTINSNNPAPIVKTPSQTPVVVTAVKTISRYFTDDGGEGEDDGNNGNGSCGEQPPPQEMPCFFHDLPDGPLFHME